MTARNPKSIFAVLNLSWTCMKKDLQTHFANYGRVIRVSIPMDRKTGFNKRVAFVEMLGPEGFEDKIFQDYHIIDHQEVTVHNRKIAGASQPTTDD